MAIAKIKGKLIAIALNERGRATSIGKENNKEIITKIKQRKLKEITLKGG